MFHRKCKECGEPLKWFSKKHDNEYGRLPDARLRALQSCLNIGYGTDARVSHALNPRGLSEDFLYMGMEQLKFATCEMKRRGLTPWG